ncbi:MAG TPA: hypothetical protein VMU67_16370 [Steroidobacteraceae bacterium]|nr:hypothetical protein [Steroidobacteraceae bacterium]
MPGVFAKLNLGPAVEVVVLEAPASFGKELAALGKVKVARAAKGVKQVAFALIFVTAKNQIGPLWKSVLPKAVGDAVIWFAYPKGTSKRYASDLNRDHGWDAIRESGWDTVRQIAIDEDWSALRFRRTEFISRRPAPAKT